MSPLIEYLAATALLRMEQKAELRIVEFKRQCRAEYLHTVRSIAQKARRAREALKRHG